MNVLMILLTISEAELSCLSQISPERVDGSVWYFNTLLLSSGPNLWPLNHISIYVMWGAYPWKQHKADWLVLLTHSKESAARLPHNTLPSCSSTTPTSPPSRSRYPPYSPQAPSIPHHCIHCILHPLHPASTGATGKHCKHCFQWGYLDSQLSILCTCLRHNLRKGRYLREGGSVTGDWG